ncbi:hypothetical protein KX729_14685 [Rhizobium sp. XQZ8]|uniref:hypothetical protein n=1 Tax=Rhizobium populisoli TaxID=2859785 RepID=UPI001CA55308|nr:hypothetical protein [Rhizobium populisoli]MBW6422701.1 hypothetical protein [Rhizobium populisoli]
MSRSPVEADHSASLYLPLSIAAGLILLAVGGAAFYGWITYGSSIFLAMAETGLSWCM